jgi:membrane-associated phospholipid phosphatase
MSERTDVRSAWIALAVTLTATALAMLVDRTVFEFINAPNVYASDLGKLLRVMGFAGTWLALAMAVGLVQGSRRGWLLFWSPMLAGALAEVIKLAIRRERPALNDGAYGFRAWDERTWSGSGLAFPSSHAAVAFGGAFMLGRLFPRARWVGYVLAIGCGLTRIGARAHFVSDVVFAAGLGWLVSWALMRASAKKAVVVLALLAIGMSPPSLGAQESCSVYQQCALSIVPRFSGLVVVQGASEVPRANLGFIIPGKPLDHVFAGDTTAVRFGREALGQRRVGALLTMTTVLTAVAGGILAADADQRSMGNALLAGAAVQGIATVYFQFKADASLARAVWWYNRRYTR